MSLMRGVAVGAVVLALAGCTAAPTDPMNDQLRAGIRQQLADDAWNTITADYPEAIRPKVEVGPLLTDVDWITQTTACFKGAGFVVSHDGAQFAYNSSSGQSQLEFVVASYVCEVKVVPVSEVLGLLDPYQLGDLYDYYVHTVRQCLLLAGQSVSAPPARADFEERGPNWNPYDDVWARDPRAATLRALELQCPPVPGWLHL